MQPAKDKYIALQKSRKNISCTKGFNKKETVETRYCL